MLLYEVETVKTNKTARRINFFSLFVMSRRVVVGSIILSYRKIVELNTVIRVSFLSFNIVS